MPLTKPRTTIAFRHNGRAVTLSRHGIIPLRGKLSVESLLVKHGVNGQIVVRHAVPGRLVVITQHWVV
jgi:hypothetical protein